MAKFVQEKMFAQEKKFVLRVRMIFFTMFGIPGTKDGSLLWICQNQGYQVPRKIYSGKWRPWRFFHATWKNYVKKWKWEYIGETIFLQELGVGQHSVYPQDRGTVPDVFDEADVLEKLQTLWEAVNVIKNNEENMAVRLVQQDAVLKRIPDGAMDKLGTPIMKAEYCCKISPYKLRIIVCHVSERISAGSLDKLEDEGRITGGLKGVKELSAEDIQVIFNNLSSLVIESGAMKEKLQVSDIKREG